MMMTVLIILLAYSLATFVLNTLASGMMAYLWRKEEEFIGALLFGSLSLKFILHPYWIKAFYWMMRLTIATIVCMVRGKWYP